MALSLDKLVRKRSDKPPRIAIYGPGGIGKTSLAAEFPAPVFIQTEDGSGDLEITSFSEGALTEWAEVNDALIALASEPHDFKTLVVDSVTRLEPIVWREACARNKWANIEEPGYGKGYLAADEIWREYVKACDYLRDNCGMTIVHLGHEGVESFNDPTTEPYNRYMMRLHKRAEAMLRESVDVLGFMTQVTMVDRSKSQAKAEKPGRAIGGGQRSLNVGPRPAFAAKNRFDMPDQILINRGAGYSALSPYLPGHRGAAAAAA